jgi:ATP-dependent DNA helicase RecG
MNKTDFIQSLLNDTESYRVERTESITNMDKYCEAICAFSNDLGGSSQKGYLIIGAKDNGELSGLKVDDRFLLQISNIRTDGNILPQPIMIVEKYSFDSGDLLVIEVTPSEHPPVRYRGRVCVRMGPRKSIASEAEEKILIEKRLSHITSFDELPCRRASLDDLDIELFKKEYLLKAIAEDVLIHDNRAIEDQLSSLGFYDRRFECPTNAAILLFGRNPERYLHGAYIQYVSFNGLNKAADIKSEFKFEGNLIRSLSKIDTFIETNIAAKRPIPVSVLREEMVFNYPYWATRELIMKAVMHRDYESNGPIQFYEYIDRIEILNHGGLYGKVSAENFPNTNDYRNPLISQAMKVLGYVNRFSRGIARVQMELSDNSNGAAEFDFTLLTAFKVLVRKSTKAEKIQFEQNSELEIGRLNGKLNDKLNETQNKIYNAIMNDSGINANELSIKLNVPISTINKNIGVLVKLKLIERRGSRKTGGYYKLSE